MCVAPANSAYVQKVKMASAYVQTDDQVCAAAGKASSMEGSIKDVKIDIEDNFGNESRYIGPPTKRFQDIVVMHARKYSNRIGGNGNYTFDMEIVIPSGQLPYGSLMACEIPTYSKLYITARKAEEQPGSSASSSESLVAGRCS